MKTETYMSRIEKVRREMQKQGVDLFLAGPSSNLKYLTGFSSASDERLLLFVIPALGTPFVIVNRLYENEAAAMPAADFVFWSDGEDPVALLKTCVEKRGLNSVHL
jgi:Xaa-Pro dipeptidase